MATTPRLELHRAYWEAIVRRVCSVCLDQGTDGSCGLSHARMCALRVHLPAVVDTILSIQSDRMDDYVAAVEAQICTRCAESDELGRCDTRDRGECALSAYLSLVVDAIDEVRASQ
jgi:hypothetical protein